MQSLHYTPFNLDLKQFFTRKQSHKLSQVRKSVGIRIKTRIIESTLRTKKQRQRTEYGEVIQKPIKISQQNLLNLMLVVIHF